MTCPGTYPTVLNGEVSSSDNTTVEFACASGFYMTGNKRITCTAGVWESAPSCSVIRQYDEIDVFPDWWFYVLAGLLGAAILVCFLCLLCYFCCCRGNIVHPYGGYHDGGCCGRTTCCGRLCSRNGCCSSCCQGRSRAPGDDMDGGGESGYYVIRNASSPSGQNGVFLVPMNDTPAQGDFFVIANKTARHSSNSKTPSKNNWTNTETQQGRTTTTKTRSTNTETDQVYFLSTIPNGVHPHSTTNGHTWTAERVRVGSKPGKDSSNLETQSDDYDRPVKGKKQARELKAWMPHSHPVRNINTSTK